MLKLERERVRQLIASGVLVAERREPRQVWVSVASIEARLASPWHKNHSGLKDGD